MLSNARIGAVIPVTDLDRARSFYERVLGLHVGRVMEAQRTVFYEQNGTRLTIYERQTPSSGEHTIATLSLGEDFGSAVQNLVNQGVTFDTFEIPGVQMDWDEYGILHDGSQQTGWFTDPDGNILAIDND
jgi:catechol 2,3-dioxygenase-like lactoylglutathione lyase family enzyme